MFTKLNIILEMPPPPIKGRGRLGGWTYIGRLHSFMKSERGNRVNECEKGRKRKGKRKVDSKTVK
jgi:hypothetical protein